jgi:hypothetical protein
VSHKNATAKQDRNCRYCFNHFDAPFGLLLGMSHSRHDRSSARHKAIFRDDTLRERTAPSELQNRCIIAEAQPANKTIATAQSGAGKTHWPAAHALHIVIIAALTLGRLGCTMVDWSRPFDNPIQPPKGKKLVTLKDAAAYILALPKSKQPSPEWQAAGEAVIMAAERSRTSNACSRRDDAGAARCQAERHLSPPGDEPVDETKKLLKTK